MIHSSAVTEILLNWLPLSGVACELLEWMAPRESVHKTSQTRKVRSVSALVPAIS